MAQHDYNIADQSGADFLVDINALLQAVATTNSGTSRPATVSPGQQWIKTDYAADTWAIYLYDGTQDVLIGTVNTATHKSVSDDAKRLNGQPGAYYDDAPSGTSSVFYQAAAPTGWTQVTSVNDRVLRVVSGTGGGTGGGWTITGLNVLGHTLSISEIPAHNHGGGNHNHEFPIAGGTTGGDSAARSYDTTPSTPTTFSGTIIDTQGGGGSHDHGISHNGGWRPSYIDVIVCQRSK